MPYLKQMENAFVQAFLKNWQGLKKEETLALQIRKQELDTAFVFTGETIKNIRRVNELLMAHQDKVKMQAANIFALLEKLVVKEAIDSYEVDVILQCYNDSYYAQWHNEFVGEPFYQRTLNIHCRNTTEMFYDANWNEFILEQAHPLQYDVHCYSFRNLYYESPLAWEDILRIDYVCVNVVVQNRFMLNVGRGK